MLKKHDYLIILKSLDLKQKQQQAQQLLRDYFRMIQQLELRQPLQQRLQQQLLMRIPLRLIVQQLLQLQETGFKPSLKTVFSQRWIIKTTGKIPQHRQHTLQHILQLDRRQPKNNFYLRTRCLPRNH